MLDYMLKNCYCNIEECYEKKKIWNGILHHIHYIPKTELGVRFLAYMRGDENESAYSAFEKAMLDENVKEACDILLEKKKGRPVGSKNFSSIDLESLAKETVTLDIADELVEKGWKLTRVGEDVSYLVKVEKDIKVIKVITPKYKRSDEKEEKIYQAVKDEAFPHSVCTASLAADIINAKYNLDVPIYRYSKYLNSQGIPLSEMDLTNYVKRSDEILKPLYDAIRDKLINQTVKVIHSDETPIEVLDYLKNENRKNGYILTEIGK